MKICELLKKSLDEYITSKFAIKEEDYGCFIVTPFLDYMNDKIRLYIFKRGGKRLEISDIGNTLEHLKEIGVNYTEGRRFDQIQMIANRFGLNIENDYITKSTDMENIAQDICYFISAMQEIGSYHLIARPRALFDFKKNVYEFFKENNIRPLNKHYVMAKSQRKYRIDFILREGKLLCQTLHAEHIETASNIITRYIAEFIDIKESDETKDSLVIYNDKSPVIEKAIFFTLMAEKVDYVIPFKERDEILRVVKRGTTSLI